MGSLNSPVDTLFTEGINEVIVSTRNNAAPMGIIRKNNSLSMIVFRTSHTAENIIRDGWIVAHITYDPVLFVTTAFEDLPKESYIQEQIEDILVERIRTIPSWIVCRAHVENTTPEKIFVSLIPVHVEILPALPRPVHRGLNNIIEATVHGTRFVLNKDPALANLIRHHANLVMRCGGEQEKRALRLLFSYINACVPGTFE